MCDESKKTDKEISEETKVETREETKEKTREETSKPRKGYFLYGVKVGLVVGFININLFLIMLGPMLYYYLSALSVFCIFSIYPVFKYRTQGVKNILKILAGIILGMIIMMILVYVWWASIFEIGLP